MKLLSDYSSTDLLFKVRKEVLFKAEINLDRKRERKKKHARQLVSVVNSLMVGIQILLLLAASQPANETIRRGRNQCGPSKMSCFLKNLSKSG